MGLKKCQCPNRLVQLDHVGRGMFASVFRVRILSEMDRRTDGSLYYCRANLQKKREPGVSLRLPTASSRILESIWKWLTKKDPQRPTCCCCHYTRLYFLLESVSLYYSFQVFPNMSILEYNGAAIIAMAGKDCVGIAADRRLGINLQTVSTDFTKVFKLAPKVYVGLAGLATDVQTVKNVLDFRMELYKLKEEREMSPKVLSHLLSTLLYEKRFGPYFVEPIVAGLDESGKPFLSGMDLIGATVAADDFCVSGTCTGNMYGMCESLYRPEQSPEELFETLAQALLSSVDRDAISGWGGVVHIITKDGVMTKELKGRQD
jgi:20S proteasome subunit beta 3